MTHQIKYILVSVNDMITCKILYFLTYSLTHTHTHTHPPTNQSSSTQMLLKTRLVVVIIVYFKYFISSNHFHDLFASSTMNGV